MTHLTFEQISEIAERGESGEDAHLAACAQCRDTLARVQGLLAATRALPRDVEPPADVWPALRARLARERTPARASWWHNGWLAAAAAIILVAGTAIVTSTVAPRAKASKTGAPAAAAVPIQSAAVLAVEKHYAHTLAQLRETLESERAALSPATIRTVERSLAVIDSAILEARRALAEDPGNGALTDILSAHYERKVDLLQRATKLSTL